MADHTEKYGTMLDPEVALARLKESGAHMTAQRRAVLDILAGNRTHPTAEAIIAQVKDRLGSVAPATIYNTLESLESLGFVRKIEGLEQRSHFDPDTSAHQHAICTECKRVWDVSPTDLPGDLPEGFHVDNVLFQGTCAECTDV